MERTPEPELMEDDTQARAYAEADFDEPHSLVVRALVDRVGPLPEHGVAIDLGCGPADIAIRVARALPGWRVDGVDGSPAMLRCGEDAVQRAGLGDRVRLVSGRLPEAELPEPAYDLVFSNSLLHHLPEPSILWEAVKRAAKPGAPVFVMDLMRPRSRPEAEAMVARYSCDEPEVLKRDFLASLLAAYEVGEVREAIARAGLSLQVEAVSDRHLVAWGRV